MKAFGPVHAFFNAWVFLTRLPCPDWVEHSARHQSQAACHAPLIGIIVGGVTGLLVIGLALIWPPAVVVALSMAFSVWLTGAFHEDGLGDVCDGFGGGWSRDQTSAIMKDSRIGAFGTIGLVLILLIKYVTLTEIVRLLLVANSETTQWAYTLAWMLVAGHSLSRFAAVSFMFTDAYAGSDQASKSGFIATPMRISGFLYAAGCGLISLLVLSFWYPLAVIALPAVWFTRAYMRRLFTRRLGGYTGDCLGAVQQLTEVVFYLSVCAVL